MARRNNTHQNEGRSLGNLAKPGVLVVGDWVVDEHWVVGDHRWPSSSRIGLRHSRALHRDDCSVRSLCGAGQVATILHQALDGTKRFLQVFGIGLWRPYDTAAIASMLDPINNRSKTPHAIWHPEPTVDPYPNRTGRLFNLANDNQKTNVGTTRVIRIYQQTGDTVGLMQRVDWELPIAPSAMATMLSSIGSTLGPLASHASSIGHILIKDLRKGVVSRPLIRWILDAFPDAAWYISSKAWMPDWLDDLADADRARVKLIVIPEIAVLDGIRTKKIPSSPWITRGGEPAEDGLNLMNEAAERFKEARIVALPAGLSVLAREPGTLSRKLCGLVQPEPFSFKGQAFVSMASVFFPTLVARLIADTASGKSSLSEELKVSLSFTRQWMQDESRRLTEQDWVPPESQVLNIGSVQPAELYLKWRSFPWIATTSNWAKAFSGLGVLTLPDSLGGNPKHEFHLWRAMTDISGYVACVQSKRNLLRQLLQEGSSFVRDRSRHRSFMIIDAPGSGKSFLVHRLARSLSMRCLSFNITQMHTRNDLIECFDAIVTSQAQEPNQAVLVFVDEINAKLDGQHVYDAFLAPLEEGIYVRAGKTFHIGPCLWIFAGTEEPVPRSKAVPHDRSDKGSDFESRLTLPPFELGLTLRGEGEGARKHEELSQMEKVYTGVSAIRTIFQDVRLVSMKVLEVFKLLPLEVKPREISRFVKSFEFVQYGRVVERNLPRNWHASFGPKPLPSDATESERVVHHELLAAWEAKIERWSKLAEPEDSLVEIRGESGYIE